jgi:acetolactate decarboxylase
MAALACILFVAAGCADRAASPPIEPDRVTQVSVINALMLGRYDGLMTIRELVSHGDFGLGTLDHLDGELVVLEGRAYQVRSDGVVSEVGPGLTTPFAVVTPFAPDGEISLPAITTLVELEARLDDALPQKNSFVAIRIDGRFDSVTLRSVGRQEPPYRPLAEVAEGQSVWTRQGVRGTLVGIRCPAWVAGLNVPGYHWHFLSEDRKVGGHVLDCRSPGARVRYDVCGDWLVKLDESAGHDATDLGRDLSRELRRVEGTRGGAGDLGR